MFYWAIRRVVQEHAIMQGDFQHAVGNHPYPLPDLASDAADQQLAIRACQGHLQTDP